MGFYQDRILPFLIHLAMRQDRIAAYRRRVVSAAEGRVLEIGVGSGLNLPFYGSGVARVIGLDPSARLIGWAREAGAVVPVDFLAGSAERIPLDAASVDTIVTTWTLCSIPDASAVLGEMRRVLRPAGRLLFVEHGLAPDAKVRRWQDALTPAWKRIAGGFHLNRPIAELIAGSGFRIERLETGYMPGPKLVTFMFEGAARPA